MRRVQRPLATWVRRYQGQRGVYGYLHKEHPRFEALKKEYEAKPVERLRPPAREKRGLISRLREALKSPAEEVRPLAPASNVDGFVDWYRRYGHTVASVNPLTEGVHSYEPFCFDAPLRPVSDELCPAFHGFEPSDPVSLEAFPGVATIAELQAKLHSTYCGPVALELDHVETSVERHWLSTEFEKLGSRSFDAADRVEFAEKMVQSQNFDNFLAAKYAQVKRYGGEGAESLIVFFLQLFKVASGDLSEVVIGIPHRGRLNLLVTLLNFAPSIMFRKMQGLPEFPANLSALGDVLSHLSTSVDLKYEDRPLRVALLPNPSHLEAVDPVVLGRCRGREQTLQVGDYDDVQTELPGSKVLGVMVHGDGSVAGQGILQECLMLSNAPHFRTGGTVHFVVNNQIGYTTPTDRGRSTRYCTDVAKMVSAPVIHVNGDFPEEVAKAAELALAYRNTFRKDIFVDMLCYRRWGHNELDDPSFTQPRMYRGIAARRSVPDVYAEGLIRDNVWTDDARKSVTADHTAFLTGEVVKGAEQNKPQHLSGHWTGMTQAPSTTTQVWDTGVDVDLLRYSGAASVTLPDSFTVHQHLARTHVKNRLKSVKDGNGINWATAEAMAFGSLLMQGFDVRVSGQDVGRGTFSQRHAMFVDVESEDLVVPLNHTEGQSGFLEVSNSILSEEAVLGFEYGMSIESPKRLCIWEAQFGDFFNGAQIIIDTFVTSGETKWLRQSGLVMLLPHGYDGAGPEHTSCRIERFLQMCDSSDTSVDSDNVNFEFANPTTSAQYFHLLRRQMVRPYRKPLVVASPKILLRHPAATSSLSDMTNGTFYRPVIGDDSTGVERVICTSGKHAYLLEGLRREGKLRNAAILRLETLCPFPAEQLRREMNRFPFANEFIWAQEEPKNMGAWSFVQPRFANLLGISLKYAGRPVLPTPAVSASAHHKKEIDDLVNAVF